MTKQINITIGEDGSVEIESSGFKGKSCAEVTKVFEQALGSTKERKFKPEYYQQEESKHQQKASN